MRLLAMSLCAVILLHPRVAGAEDVLQASDNEQAAVRKAVQAGRIKPLKDIVSMVQATHPGKMSSVELVRDFGGHPLYKFKFEDSSGSSRDLYVDAVDGHNATAHFQPSAVKPMSQVLRKLMQNHAGQVIGVDLEQWRDARQVYEVIILADDNRMREIIVDARTGEVLQADSERVSGLDRLYPVSAVIDAVLEQYTGQVQEVEIEVDNTGQRYYEVELRMDDGRVFEVHADAKTGTLLRAAEES